jgi:hypothetical protein
LLLSQRKSRSFPEIVMRKRKNLKKSSQGYGPCVLLITLFLMLLIAPAETHAQMSAAEEMARKLANPLANIHAILTETDVFFFDSGNGQKKGELYSFKLTPVWAIDVEDKGYSVIPRAVVPLNGRFRSTSDHIGRIWGVGDIALQIFVAPKTESAWKWGIGPQFSFKTSSQPQLGGIGHGIGLSGVFVGNLSSKVSLAVLVGNTWSLDGEHSIASIQPFLSYNFKSVPGLYINYQQATTINWKAEGTKVSLPIGAGIGRTWALGDRGHGFDFNFGIYFFPIRSDRAPLWSLKFGIGFVLP